MCPYIRIYQHIYFFSFYCWKIFFWVDILTHQLVDTGYFHFFAYDKLAL